MLAKGNVRPNLGLHSHVPGVAAEDPAGDLEAVAQVEAGVRRDRVVPEVEVRDELWVSQHEHLDPTLKIARLEKAHDPQW